MHRDNKRILQCQGGVTCGVRGKPEFRWATVDYYFVGNTMTLHFDCLIFNYDVHVVEHSIVHYTTMRGSSVDRSMTIGLSNSIDSQIIIETEFLAVDSCVIEPVWIVTKQFKSKSSLSFLKSNASFYMYQITNIIICFIHNVSFTNCMAICFNILLALCPVPRPLPQS